MKEKLETVFDQIQEGMLNQEEALQRIKELRYQHKHSTQTEQNQRQIFSFPTEEYVYGEPILKGHRVNHEQVLIGMAYGSLAMNIFFKMFPDESRLRIRKLNFLKAVAVGENQRLEVKVEPLVRESNIDFKAWVRHPPMADWGLAATGILQKSSFAKSKRPIREIQNGLTEFEALDKIYTGNPIVALGENFKTIDRLYSGEKQALARFVMDLTPEEDGHTYVLHPLIHHSIILAGCALIKSLEHGDGILAFGIKEMDVIKTKRLDSCWLWVRLKKNSREMITFDAEVIDDGSLVVASLKGCSMKRVRSGITSNKSQVPKELSMSKNISFLNIKSETTVPKASDNQLGSRIQGYLNRKLKKILGNGSMNPDPAINLMDMGLESKQLTILTSEVEKETGIELFPTLFFEYPSIKELTKYFSDEHGPSFQHLFSNAPGYSLLHDDSESIEKTSKNQSPPTALITTRKKRDREQNGNDMAVIGMNGRFAEAENLDQFWINLRDQKDVIKEIPLSHWDYRPWFDSDPEARDKTCCKWGSFIDDVDKFDTEFFRISPREAKWMDPQLRLLMQNIYATGEDAGYITQLRGTNTGVFVGACFQDYSDKFSEMNLSIDPYAATGNSPIVMSNRISFYFDFKGPSLTVNSGCSSSLYALHLACNALKNNECDLAFVSGVNLLLSSIHYRRDSAAGVLSPTGRCHSFDEAADGYVPGECIASILLKPLSRALKDGDRIEAIVKGSAALHGGYTPSLTAPSVAGEENTILKAWNEAGIDPETITYIEAHGTGTPLGDQVEIKGLKRAFKRFTNKESFCAIGSVKANIGHAEGAAGIASMIKVILQMKYQQIPPMPEFNKLNPYINLKKSPLYINREVEEWKTPSNRPKRAGISSHGYTGTNCHVVLEEYPIGDPDHSDGSVDQDFEEPTTAKTPIIIVLSAKNRNRLEERSRQLLSALSDRQLAGKDIIDIAYTLQVGREHMEERMGMIVETIPDLKNKLESFLKKKDDIPDCCNGNMEESRSARTPFADDEDMEALINTWLEKKKFSKLLAVWVNGWSIDWNKLYSGSRPRKLSLPTYPFARERHWISDIGEMKTRARRPEAMNRTDIVLSEKSTEKQITDFVVRFLCRELDIEKDQISLDRNIHDYGWESMASMKLIRLFEKHYQIKIKRREMLSLQTIHSLVNFLTERVTGTELQKPIPLDNIHSEDKSVNPGTGILDEYQDSNILQAIKEVEQGSLDLADLYSMLHGKEESVHQVKSKELYLIIPPLQDMVNGFPIGLNYIRCYLKQKSPDINVTILNLATCKPGEVIDILDTIPAEALVGITTVTASYQTALNLAKKFKKRGNRIILGGAHASKQARIILRNHDFIDYVAIGEGERTVYDIFHVPIHEVSGLAFRSGNEVFINPEKKLSTEELSAINFTLDHLSHDESGKVRERFNILMRYSSSRGCTAGCTFCAANKQYTAKSVDSTLKDIEYILDRGFKDILFEDNFFGADKKASNALCTLIKEHGLQFNWECQTRVDIGDSNHLLEDMASAGCKGIYLGVENLDRRVLKYMNKTKHPDNYFPQADNTIQKAITLGINPIVMFQMGIEIENDEIRKNNLEKLQELARIAANHDKLLEVFISVNVAYPGTAMYNLFRRKHQLPEDFFEIFTRWEMENRDTFIRDTCPHGVGGLPLGLIDLKSLEAGKIQISKQRFQEMKKYHEAIGALENLKLLDIGEYTIQ